MLVERRRSILSADLLIRVGASWFIVASLLLAINWQGIAERRFPDPDDTMRLMQVRDLIAGQGWFDLTQYRVDAPGGGVPMHWSRLVDLPLFLVITLLSPLIGAYAAETAALVIVPLVTLFLAMLLTARIAWRLLGEEEAMLTALILAISVPVLFQLGPMRIDHHGWQIVFALLAMNGLMARSARAGGLVIGAACATWLTISIEGLPLAAAIFAVLALRWLRDRDGNAWLVSATQALAVTGIALFVMTRGVADLATYCDALSPLHLAMFGWGAVVLTLLRRIEPVPIALVIAGFVLAGGGAAALMIGAAPQCVSGGGFSDLDPLVVQHWYYKVHEGLPIWLQKPGVALQYGVTPFIGLWSAVRLVRESRAWLARFWTDYALILAAAAIIALFVARAGALACILAAPPLAWQVRHWLRASRLIERPGRRIAALLAVAIALLPSLPLVLALSAMPASAAHSVGMGSIEAVRSVSCRVPRHAELLDSLSPGEIYAPLDISPDLLSHTHHSVIATGHHRGNETMRFVIATALGPTEEARKALASRGTAYLAMCPKLNEIWLYRKAAPGGFVARLVDGDVPDWLEPVEAFEGTGIKVWRIRP